MLADFSFTPAEQIFENLKKSGSMAGVAKPYGRRDPKMSTQMASMTRSAGAMASMSKGDAGPDLNDVKYDAFLANDRTLADPEIVKVEPGGRVLLRIINSSSMSAFHVGLGALEGELIAVDGFAVAPIRGHEFPVAVAQRLDIRLSLPPVPAPIPCLRSSRVNAVRPESSWSQPTLRSSRIPDAAETPSPALTLDLERTLARPDAACRAQGRPRPHPEPHRRNGRLCLVDQQRRVEQGRSAASPSPRASGSSSSSSTRRRCPTRCICTGMNFRSSRSTASASQARCATRSWSPPAAGWSWRSTPTIRAGGPSTATCSTTSTQACSRRSSTCDGVGLGCGQPSSGPSDHLLPEGEGT